MSWRDELDEIHATLLADAKTRREYAGDLMTALYGYSEGAEHALDTVRIRGYSKPRTIATVEELDALRRGAAVLDANKRVWTSDGDSLDQWGCVHHDEYPQSLVWRGPADIALPAIVLYDPEVTK